MLVIFKYALSTLIRRGFQLNPKLLNDSTVGLCGKKSAIAGDFTAGFDSWFGLRPLESGDFETSHGAISRNNAGMQRFGYICEAMGKRITKFGEHSHK